MSKTRARTVGDFGEWEWEIVRDSKVSGLSKTVAETSYYSTEFIFDVCF